MQGMLDAHDRLEVISQIALFYEEEDKSMLCHSERSEESLMGVGVRETDSSLRSE